MPQKKIATIDKILIDEVLSLMLFHHKKAITSVKKELKSIANVINAIYQKFNYSKKGR